MNCGVRGFVLSPYREPPPKKKKNEHHLSLDWAGRPGAHGLSWLDVFEDLSCGKLASVASNPSYRRTYYN